MSQAKVDRHKKEKEKRPAKQKRNKAIKLLSVFVVALGVGAAIGVPLGKHIYKVQKAENEAAASISATEYKEWFDQQYNDYGDIFGISTATDASTTDASVTDAQ